MHRRFFAAYFAAQRTMATDENNHKNEARDDWTGCTFRVERGPSSEGRAWGMADILTDVRRRVYDNGAAPMLVEPRPAEDHRLHGRVRSCSPSPPDLTSGGPARGLHAPPGPNGLLQGRHVPPALLPPHRPLTPRVVSSLPQRS